jgi:hypothetical protein
MLSNYFTPASADEKLLVPEDVCRTHPFYVNANERLQLMQPKESMDDYLAAVLGTSKMCQVNSLIYNLLDACTPEEASERAQQSLRTLMFKVKSTIVHGLYHAYVEDYPHKDFVSKKQWPKILSFSCNRMNLQDNLVVPIPYEIPEKKQAEYSSCLLQFYEKLCNLQGIPYNTETMHLHKYGWLRHTDTDLLVQAAKQLSKGLFDTLRHRALRALDHVLGLGLSDLIQALCKVDSDELAKNPQAPVQKPLSKEVAVQVKNKINDLFFKCNDWLVEHGGCEGFLTMLEPYADGRLRFAVKCRFLKVMHEDFLRLHKPLNRLVFGLMMYGGKEYFRDGDFFDPSVHCDEIGFRRDHVNIGFSPMDDISVSVYRYTEKTGSPRQTDILFRIIRTTKRALHKPLLLHIDASSTMGQFLWLLMTLGHLKESPALFFHIKEGKACRHTTALYKTMRRFFEIPPGMSGTIAARLTKAEACNLQKAEDVCASGGLTAKIVASEQKSARCNLHSVQQHQNYAVRAAKRKMEIDSETEDYADISEED